VPFTNFVEQLAIADRIHVRNISQIARLWVIHFGLRPIAPAAVAMALRTFVFKQSRASGRFACDGCKGFAARFASSGTIHGPGCKNAYTADPAAASSTTTNITKINGDFLRDALVIQAKSIFALQELQLKLLRKIFVECGARTH